MQHAMHALSLAGLVSYIGQTGLAFRDTGHRRELVFSFFYFLVCLANDLFYIIIMSYPTPSGRSALEVQRAVLAALMPVTLGEKAVSDFRDPRVCSNYLCGLCPPELFVNTKFQLPACSLLHDDNLKQRYEEASSKPGGPNFEMALLHLLEDIVTKNDRAVSFEVRKAEESEGPNIFIPRVEVQRLPEVEAAELEVTAKVKEASIAMENGNSIMSGQLEEEAEVLRRKKCLLQARAVRATPHPPPQGKTYHPKLRVCSGCGHFLNLIDAEDRMADHFQGRGHLGFVISSQWISKIKEKFKRR